MIEFFRSKIRSTVAIVIIGLVILAFIVITDQPLNFGGGGGGAVAEVGDEEITVAEFRQSFSRRLRDINQLNVASGAPPYSVEQALSLGLGADELRRLVLASALRQEALELGVQASDSAVFDYIRTQPEFFGAGGAFDPAVYGRAFGDNNQAERRYEEAIRAGLTADLVRSAALSSAPWPRAAAEAVWLAENEARTVSFVRVDADRVQAALEADEEALRAYHRDNAERYASPERRTVAVFWLRADDVARPEEVSEAELQALYEERRAQLTTPERRSLSQLLFRDQAAAEDAAARITDGQAFERVAADASQEATQTDLGYLSLPDLARFGDDMAQAIFGAAQGDVVGPFQTPFGWALFEIQVIRPETTPSFADTRDALAEEMALSDARRRLPELANTIEDERAGGANLVSVARSLGLETREITIDAQLRGPDGSEPEALPPDEALAARAFQLDGADRMDLVELPRGLGFYAMELIRVEESAPRPFEDVRDQVAVDWRRDSEAAAIEAEAEAILAALEDGGSFAAVAEERGYALETIEELTRRTAQSDLPESVVLAAFEPNSDTAAGSAFQHALEGQGGRVRLVVQIIAVTPADLSQGAADVAAIADGEGLSVSRTLGSLFDAATLRDYRWTYDPAQFSRAFEEPAHGGY